MKKILILILLGFACTLIECCTLNTDCTNSSDSCIIYECNTTDATCYRTGIHIEDGTSCPNLSGNPCLITECYDGVCTPHSKDCSNSSDSCIIYECNTTNGTCYSTGVPKPDWTTCPDNSGQLCAMPFCSSGICYMFAKNCPTTKCYDNVCNETTGNCDHINYDNTTVCNFGLNPCEVDHCDGNGSCVNTGHYRTEWSSCPGGYCVDNSCCASSLCCLTDDDCDDGDPCTTEICDNHTCRYTDIECPSLGECIVGRCNSNTGLCMNISADDWSNCTGGICHYGSCCYPPDCCNTVDDCASLGVCYECSSNRIHGAHTRGINRLSGFSDHMCVPKTCHNNSEQCIIQGCDNNTGDCYSTGLPLPEGGGFGRDYGSAPCDLDNNHCTVDVCNGTDCVYSGVNASAGYTCGNDGEGTCLDDGTCCEPPGCCLHEEDCAPIGCHEAICNISYIAYIVLRSGNQTILVHPGECIADLSAPLPNGTACTLPNSEHGVCVNGNCTEHCNTTADCNDHNECTLDSCLEDHTCLNTLLPDIGNITDFETHCSVSLCNPTDGVVTLTEKNCTDYSNCTLDSCSGEGECIHRNYTYNDSDCGIIPGRRRRAVTQDEERIVKRDVIRICRVDACMDFICYDNVTGNHSWIPSYLGKPCNITVSIAGQCNGAGYCVANEELTASIPAWIWIVIVIVILAVLFVMSLIIFLSVGLRRTKKINNN